jgi:hypothetical protein
MYRNAVILILVFSFAVSFQSSPPFIITGKVCDENGRPIPFASVSVKGTTKTVITNNDGTFFLKFDQKNPTLEIKAIAYKMATIRTESGKGTTIQLIKLIRDELPEIEVAGAAKQKIKQP